MCVLDELRKLIKKHELIWFSLWNSLGSQLVDCCEFLCLGGDSVNFILHAKIHLKVNLKERPEVHQIWTFSVADVNFFYLDNILNDN